MADLRESLFSSARQILLRAEAARRQFEPDYRNKLRINQTNDKDKSVFTFDEGEIIIEELYNRDYFFSRNDIAEIWEMGTIIFTNKRCIIRYNLSNDEISDCVDDKHKPIFIYYRDIDSISIESDENDEYFIGFEKYIELECEDNSRFTFKETKNNLYSSKILSFKILDSIMTLNDFEDVRNEFKNTYLNFYVPDEFIFDDNFKEIINECGINFDRNKLPVLDSIFLTEEELEELDDRVAHLDYVISKSTLENQNDLNSQLLTKKFEDIEKQVSTMNEILNYFDSNITKEDFDYDLHEENEYLFHCIFNLEQILSETDTAEKISHKSFYSDIYKQLNSIKNKYDHYCKTLGFVSCLEDNIGHSDEELGMNKEKLFESSQVQYNELVGTNLTLESIFIEINNLIGLNKVKDKLYEIINLTQIQNERTKYGISNTPINRHLVFLGSPGTGKTTIARIVGKFYKELGILSSGHFIEADRSMLIGGYLGQSALKTSELLKSAYGGVLFIDEAYSLYKDDDSYGNESIETILKYMEDNREDFILIVAGYELQMRSFLNSNPGFKSRFNTFLEFHDYNQDELFQILIKLSIDSGYNIDSSSYPKLNKIIKRILELKGENFANARTMRNFLEKSIRHQANRLISYKGRTKNDLLTLIKDDFSYDDIDF